MANSNIQTFFLATTAIEEFWDPSKPMLFLGEWCLRYSRRAVWEKLDGEIVDGLWKTTSDIYAAYRHVSELYEAYLPVLAQTLNKLHGVDRSNRYWRIVIGPWLLFYMHVVYDRYLSIHQVLNKYPEITTYGLAEDDFITPKDTTDFVQLVLDDPYNLQVYSKILTVLNREVPKKRLLLTGKRIVSRRPTGARALLQRIFNLIDGERKINLYDPYFDRFEELKIIVRTGATVRPHVAISDDISFPPVDTHLRSNLATGLPGNDAFTRILASMLPMDMPQSYLEAFGTIANNVRKTLPHAPLAIFSAVSWHFDEHFKQWAAESSEKGARLMGIQHGGNYGSTLFMAFEDHELAITDKFYSWGWKRSNCFSEVIPMSPSKLSSKKTIGADSRKAGILFVGSVVPRYLFRFTYLSNCQFPDYMRWQFKFAESLPIGTRNALTFRPHQVDYGWDIRQRWNDTYPDLKIEDWRIPFMESLKNCRLFVCDHLSTTFAEALALNKPSILFWDRQVNEEREEAKPFYDALRASGILHDSPEQAAAAVDAAYHDIEGWWNEPARQDARRFFCDRFVKMSSRPSREWVREFDRISDLLKDRQKTHA